MTEQKVSHRYAKAVLETAVKEGLADNVYEDFKQVGAVLKSSAELRSIIASPVIQQWRKKKILEDLFGSDKISPLTYNFLILLITKKRGVLIPSIIVQFESQYFAMKNFLPVDIVSALELSDKIKGTIVDRLADWTHKTIMPSYKIDAKIKGGMQVVINDWVFDASIKNQLAVLYKSLADG